MKVWELWRHKKCKQKLTFELLCLYSLLCLFTEFFYVLSCKSLLEEVILWTEDSCFSHKQRFEVKPSYWYICFLQTYDFSFLKTLTDMDYCDVFISCLDSHSDGTHSLQRIHCWDTDAVTHFSKSDEETNSSTSWLAWGWGCFQQIFIFGWTTPAWVRVHTRRLFKKVLKEFTRFKITRNINLVKYVQYLY